MGDGGGGGRIPVVAAGSQWCLLLDPGMGTSICIARMGSVEGGQIYGSSVEGGGICDNLVEGSGIHGVVSCSDPAN